MRVGESFFEMNGDKKKGKQNMVNDVIFDGIFVVRKVEVSVSFRMV